MPVPSFSFFPNVDRVTSSTRPTRDSQGEWRRIPCRRPVAPTHRSYYPRHTVAVLGILLFGSLVSRGVAAQIVNVQPAISQAGAEGFSLDLSGNINWRTGNIPMLDIGGQAMLRYRHGPNILVFMANARRAAGAGDPFINRTFAHNRYIRRLSDVLSLETFVQHELDRIRRLTSRALLGAGPRFVLFRGQFFNVAMGTTYMLEHQIISREAGLPDGGHELNHRSSTYLYGELHVAKNISLVHTSFFQPLFTDIRNYRVVADNSLIVTANRWMQIRLSARVDYDNAAPMNVEPWDTVVATFVSFMISPPEPPPEEDAVAL